MPVCPAHEWRETADTVTIRVYLRGAARLKPDIFATDALVKVNSPPYLFHVDLFQDVNDEESSCTVDNDGITFNLVKMQSKPWGRLSTPACKEEVEHRRNTSIERAHQRLEQARQARQQQKLKQERAATDRQIETDRRKRAEIERRKKEEMDSERHKLVAWQEGRKHAPWGGYGSDAESDSDGEAEEDAGCSKEAADAYHGRGWWPTATAHGKKWAPQRLQGVPEEEVGEEEEGVEEEGVEEEGMEEEDVEEEGVEEEGVEEEGVEEEGRTARHGADVWSCASSESEGERAARMPGGEAAGTEVSSSSSDDEAGGEGGGVPGPRRLKPPPPPRRQLEVVPVEFTQLQSSHLPAREHREEELRLYKKKLRDDAQALQEDSVDIADRTPAFLKDKGDALFRQGNYRGAVHAYSRALTLDDALLPARSNRAACHLKLGDHGACLADCDAVVGELTDRLARLASADSSSTAGEEARRLQPILVRALARRGAALCGLGELEQARRDYEKAAGMQPDDAALLRDLEEVRAALLPPDDASLRQLADARFKQQDYQGAHDAFAHLLLQPGLLPQQQRAALSNQAACCVVLERYEEAVRCCNAAIRLLLQAQNGPVPPQLAPLLERMLLPAAESSPGGSAAKGMRENAADEEAQEPAGAAASTSLELCDSARQGLIRDAAQLPAEAASSLARLLARRGAALAHLRRYTAAQRDCCNAGLLFRAAGNAEKAQALEEDAMAMASRAGLPPPAALGQKCRSPLAEQPA